MGLLTKKVKSMPAPDYFLTIWALKGPLEHEFKSLNITKEASIEEMAKSLMSSTMKIADYEKLKTQLDVYSSLTEAAWGLFRTRNWDNEFGRASRLTFDEVTKEIKITKK